MTQDDLNMTEIQKIIDMINNSRPQLADYGCTERMVNWFEDNFYAWFAPSAMMNLSVEDLAKLILIGNAWCQGRLDIMLAAIDKPLNWPMWAELS
jgi:hypothetical protein